MNDSVWIVDDDRSIRVVLTRALREAGLIVEAFERAETMLDALGAKPAPGAVVTDLRMPGIDGRALIEQAHARHPELPIIVMTAYADLQNSVDLLTLGAFDLLPKPFDLGRAVALVQSALAPRPGAEGQGEADPSASPSDLIGKAPAMMELFRTIGRLAGSELNVLLIGETGAGKEKVARALHDTSRRADGPFVAINVAAIPSELLEAELFGHEKGAFTGAEQARAGHFERAAGGTLFLDEIGDMPARMQSRLLRVLAEGDFYRLGAARALRADVRLIAATHRNLRNDIDSGRFREDLYHRLNVVQLHVPALRERREDIGPLIHHYLRESAAQMGVPKKDLSAKAMDRLAGYTWPGNIRELINLTRRLTALVPGPEIRARDLPPELSAEPAQADDWEQALRGWARTAINAGRGGILPEAVQRLEQCLIDEALAASDGAVAAAAAKLGIGRNTLTRKRAQRPDG